MNFPWRKRVAAYRQEAEEARKAFEQTVRSRKEVIAVASDLHTHRTTNGWTEKVSVIFGGGSP